MNKLENDTIVYYYEHYPHYLGTKNSEATFTVGQMDHWHKIEEAGGDGWAEMDEEEMKGYALGDILAEWPAIRKKLKKKGTWGGQWEEGSHAVSTKSFKKAKKAVGKIEAQVTLDCGDWQ